MGIAAREQRRRRGGLEGLSCQRPQISPHDCIQRFSPRSYGASCQRTLSLDLSWVCLEISSEPSGDQETSDRITYSRSGWDRHPQGAIARTCVASFYRAWPRGGHDARKENVTSLPELADFLENVPSTTAAKSA